MGPGDTIWSSDWDLGSPVKPTMAFFPGLEYAMGSSGPQGEHMDVEWHV